MDENTITFEAGQRLWLEIRSDGFYVDGEKVEDRERVYERFNEWLKKAEELTPLQNETL